MADADSVRQRIVSSVFTTKLVEETYVSHIKIWEEDASDDGGKKPRYIILSSVLLHRFLSPPYPKFAS